MTNITKMIKSGIAGQIPLIVQFVSGLVLFPYLISYFGDELFGFWVLISTITGFFGLLDMGFSKATQRFVSKAIGKNDFTEANLWNNVGILLIGVTTLIGFVLFILMMLMLSFFVKENMDIIRPALIIAGISFLIALPSRLFIGILQAHIRSDIYEIIFAMGMILGIVSNLIAIQMELKFTYFILISGVINILQAFSIVYFALRINGNIKYNKAAFTKRNIYSFADYSFSSFIANLADLARFQLYPVIISSILGIASITPFQIANNIRMIVSSIIIKSLINLTSYFSQIEGKYGVGERLKEAYLFSYKISTFLTVLVVGVTATVAQPFIYRWIGEQYGLSVTLLLIGLVGNLASGIQMPATCFLFGTSKHRFYAISNSIEAISIVLSAIILAQAYGLIGMMVGATASTVFIKTLVQPFWVTRSLNITIGTFLIRTVGKNVMISGIIFYVLHLILSNTILGSTFKQITLYSFCITIFYITIIYYLGFTKNEKSKIMQMIRRQV